MVNSIATDYIVRAIRIQYIILNVDTLLHNIVLLK